MSESPIVSVGQGQLQGRVVTSPNGKTFYSFQGIPYAKPPLGALRFKAPVPPEPWTGIRQATSEGNVSVQIDLFGKRVFTGDENCLFLNVFSPKLDGELLPVMVYIHGGALKFSSGNSYLYGPDYLIEKDVVLVTLNYRCGVLGFLSLNIPEVPGNAGMKDVVQAIRWIKSNIKNFGGDSNNITVFGESAGGAITSFLAASPLTKNLISKVIIQSGTALNTFATQKNPLQNARSLAKIVGCKSDEPEDILEFLQGCSAKQIVEAHEKLNPIDELLRKLNLFTVVSEKEFPGVEAFITEPFIDILTSGRLANLPIMIGGCTVEFAYDGKFNDLQLFIPEELNIKRGSEESLEIVEKLKQLYIGDDYADGVAKLLSDHFLKVGINRFVKYLVQVTNKPIYYYNFDYVGALNIYSKVFRHNLKYAGHMDELAHLFSNDFQQDLQLSDRDIEVRERMVRMWTNFAKFGNPTPDTNQNLPITWLPVNKDNIYYLNIGSELTLETDIDKERMEFWDDLYSKYFRIWEQPHPNPNEVTIKYKTPVIVNSIKATTGRVNNVGHPIYRQADIQTPNLNGTVIRANDPPEDDLPKNIEVNKYINFYDSLSKKGRSEVA